MMTHTETTTNTTTRAYAQGVHAADTVRMSYGEATISLVLTGSSWSVKRIDRYPSGNFRTYHAVAYANRTRALLAFRRASAEAARS